MRMHTTVAVEHEIRCELSIGKNHLKAMINCNHIALVN